LVAERLLKVRELLKVSLLVHLSWSTAYAHLLLLHEHALFSVALLKLLSEPQAFVYVDSQLNFDFL
jgi:hypothetical protein